MALHTAARRFCMDRHASWVSHYSKIESAGEARIGSERSWTYTPLAYGLFPRYRLDQAILDEVEKTTGMQSSSLANARLELIEAGNRPLNALLAEFAKSDEAIGALKDEGESFEQFVRTITDEELGAVEPLPYRRVLMPEETEILWNRFRSVWGIAGFYWFPLADLSPGMNAIAFHEELWQERGGRDLVQQALREKNIERCFVLRELGPPHYECAANIVDATYDGSESFATSDFSWLIYASHESSITVAGWLADLCRLEWRDWADLTYGGAFHTNDLRGTWRP